MRTQIGQSARRRSARGESRKCADRPGAARRATVARGVRGIASSPQHRVRVFRPAPRPHHRLPRRARAYAQHGPDGRRGRGVRHRRFQHPRVHSVAGGVSHRPVPADQRPVPERPAAAGRSAHARHHPHRCRLCHRLPRQVAPGRQPAGGVHPARPAAAGLSVLGGGQLHARLHQLPLLPRHPGAPVLGWLRRRGADHAGDRLHPLASGECPGECPVRAGAVVGAAAQPLPRPAAALPGPLSAG